MIKTRLNFTKIGLPTEIQKSRTGFSEFVVSLNFDFSPKKNQEISGLSYFNQYGITAAYRDMIEDEMNLLYANTKTLLEKNNHHVHNIRYELEIEKHSDGTNEWHSQDIVRIIDLAFNEITNE